MRYLRVVRIYVKAIDRNAEIVIFVEREVHVYEYRSEIHGVERHKKNRSKQKQVFFHHYCPQTLSFAVKLLSVKEALLYRLNYLALYLCAYRIPVPYLKCKLAYPRIVLLAVCYGSYLCLKVP